MIPGIVLRPGQIITTHLNVRYTLIAKQTDNWLCKCGEDYVERTPGFLRKHGIKLEFTCNENPSNSS